MTHPAVEKARESYTVGGDYEDGEGTRVGTVAAFNANATEILANVPLDTTRGGTAVRDSMGKFFVDVPVNPVYNAIGSVIGGMRRRHGGVLEAVPVPQFIDTGSVGIP